MKINVFSENINENVSIDERKYLVLAKKILKVRILVPFDARSNGT